MLPVPRFPLVFLFAIWWLAGIPSFGLAQEKAERKPNLILIFTDDQGYGDVGCYGAKGFKTPHLDQMAAEGIRFTSFYTGCSVCSGSRAALLTGRHYQRVGVPAVMFPGNKNGIGANEITVAGLLKKLGYATFIIGKWHLGHLPPYLPTRHGFDGYFGIPYSNDMSIDPANARFAKDCVFREDWTEDKVRKSEGIRNKVPLMRGEEVVEYPADQTTLTKRYTEEAIRFIKANKDRAFFLYLPHTMPHGPMAVSSEFQGRTKSLFGDVIEELDWSVGQILQTLKEQKLDDNTMVLFTTDNGTAAGSSGPLRAKKASNYEGGFRVPCIVRWPGKISPNSECREIAATVDVLPTFAKIAGGEIPSDRPIDGKDIRSLLFDGPKAKTPHEHYILLHGKGSVRSGPWKYYPWQEGTDAKVKEAKKQPVVKGPKVQLYNLETDLGETRNIADQHPDVVDRLHRAYTAFVAEVGKGPGKKGQED